MADTVTPYNKDSAKKEQVADMFNNIANNYDFLNHFLSMGIDILWRKKVIKMLAPKKPQTVLDIATGTGDFAIEALSMKPKYIVGLDISKEMVRVGREKLKKKNIENIELVIGDSEKLPFDTNSFDAMTSGFGVRNFEHLEVGLAEMARVLKPGGQVAILEFSMPQVFPVKQLYHFYFKFILPVIGRIISKDHRAYTYLPESVNAFPYGQALADIMDNCGFKNTKVIPVSFGIASIYLAEK